MEARRLQAIPFIDNGASLGQIAWEFDVSRTTAARWRKAWNNGSELTRRLAPGRTPKMTAADIEACKSLYAEGPAMAGLKRWTAKGFGRIIKFVLGIDYHPDHVCRLMHKWGLTTKRTNRRTRRDSE